MTEESMRLYVITSTLFLAFMLVIMLIILQIVIADHYQPDFVYTCDERSSLGFWFYRKEYVRDMTAHERLRWCPRPTRTATPVYRGN